MSAADPRIVAAAQRWREATDALLGAIAAVSEEAWARRSGCGDWTNRDLLVHLATGYVQRRATLRAVLAGEPPPRIDADAANAANVERWSRASVEGVIDELRRVRGEMLALMEALAPAHLEATIERGGTPARLGDALPEYSRHDLEHAAQLRT